MDPLGRTNDGQSRQTLRELLEPAPRQATVIRDGVELQVSGQEVQRVRWCWCGREKIPVDGHVVKGEAFVNQAPITGESMPVEKGLGDNVYSGTIIQTGSYLELIADKVGDDTTFSRIIHMVEEAQERTAPVQRFVERFARYYTPAIMVLAVLVYAITRNVLLALTLLVVASPRSLGNRNAYLHRRRDRQCCPEGVLVKGGEYLEMLGSIGCGGPRQNWHPDGRGTAGSRSEGLWRWAGCCPNLGCGPGALLGHPLARAITSQADEEGLEYPPVDDFTVLTGHGVKGVLDGQPLLLGNEKLLEREGVAIPEEIRLHLKDQAAMGRTVILLAQAGRIIGAISLADTIRQEAKELVRSLKKAGVKETIMLTGDNRGQPGRWRRLWASIPSKRGPAGT